MTVNRDAENHSTSHTHVNLVLGVKHLFFLSGDRVICLISTRNGEIVCMGEND